MHKHYRLMYAKHDSKSHRSNANEFVKMMNVDMNKHTKQTRHDLLDASNVVAWKWHAYNIQISASIFSHTVVANDQ